jgi:formylglycine-generating enzyme required for sulfatase activity
MSRLLQRSLGGAALGLALFLPFLPAPQPGPAARAEPPGEHKAYKETIPGTAVSFEMMPIPGGNFVMGSPAGEEGRKDDEGPQHPVAIRPFWMGKCEVTWDEFDVFMKEMGLPNKEALRELLKKDPAAITGPTPPYVDETYGHGRQGHPAICMTHHCAIEYCRWLSKKTGKLYRLPTEAEWEYAARAGSKTAYFFGNDPKDLGDYAWFAGNSDEEPHKVGTKKPNPWGLHDVYGNVVEWCLDHYKKDYYATFSPDKPVLEPVLLPTERRFSHVVRGGSWPDEPVACRSAARRGSDKSWLKRDPQRPQSVFWLTEMDFVGFRVLRPVEELPQLKDFRPKVTLESPN